MPRPGGRLVLLLVTVLVAVAACGDDGRELSEPRPDQTTTTVPAAGDGAVVGGDPTSSMAQLRLSSPAFEDGGTIPVEYTCRGADVSPPLAWTGVPPETAEIAVVVRDLDAGGFVHWVIAGLPPTATGLAEGAVPPEAVQAVNGFGRPGWSGPCPPSGTHNYQFVLLALVGPSGLTPDQPGEQAATAIESAPVRMSAALSGSATAA